MASFIQDEIQFTSVLKGKGLPGKYGNGNNGNFADAATDGVEPFINAVEIDWNDATGIFGFTNENPLKTTGQLLHELNTTCASKPNSIKIDGNIYKTESYIGESFIELPDYPNWYSLVGKPTTFRPIIGKTSITAAAGNHTHQTSIVASTGTGAFAFAFGSTYTLNAGGTSFEFTMPNVPAIPTKVSQLTNDKGYLTAHPAKGNPSITIGGNNTFISEIQFDDNGHFVGAYLMTIDDLKELLGIGSGIEPIIETKKYVYVGQVDPRTEGFSFDDITAVEGSVIKEEVTSKVEVPISLNGPRDYWYIAAPKSLNYTYYDSTGQINVESQINIEYITIGGIEYKIYITAGKTVSFNQVLK